jgi:hypothetical protein
LKVEIETYLNRADAPATKSPLGVVLSRVIAKNPGIDFEDARAEAKRLLDRAAAKKNYSLPRVSSAEEHAAERARLKSVVWTVEKGA